MPDWNHAPGRIRFGAFEVDFPAGELRKRGVPIRIQAQPFRVLELLLERPGELVTREELKAKLWPADTFGDFDHGLNKAVNKIRDALNDTASNPQFVQTIARRGYRFLGDVTYVDIPPNSVEPVITALPEPGDADREISGKPAVTHTFNLRDRRILASFMVVILATLVAVTLVVWQFQGARGKSTGIRSLAVLPMENLSNDVSQEYFADGMTDELITALGTISGLRVISRTSMMPYKHTRKPLREIARELNIDAVVEGTVLRSGEQVRITARLIRLTADEDLWSHSYQGDVRSTLQLQDQVATDIASHVRVRLTEHEHTLLTDAKAVDPEAYDTYLKGRYFWNKRTEEGLQRAIRYFEEAIAKDPESAHSYSGLADSYALLGDWEYGGLTPREAFPKAKAAAIQALKLDDNLGEAHASLALCLDLFDWDWKSAEAEFKKALRLNPNYATAHQWYAWHLITLGRNKEGMTELRQAERLDPLSLIISADIADALLIAHRYDESIQQSRKIVEMDPSFAMAHYQLGQALVQLRQYQDATRELRQAIDLSRGNPICTSHLAYAYAVSGNRVEAGKILDDLKTASKLGGANAANIALIYAGLNERDQAFLWLNKAYEQRFNPSILVRPAFDAVRSDGRFEGLMQRLELPPKIALYRPSQPR